MQQTRHISFSDEGSIANPSITFIPCQNFLYICSIQSGPYKTASLKFAAELCQIITDLQKYLPLSPF